MDDIGNSGRSQMSKRGIDLVRAKQHYTKEILIEKDDKVGYENAIHEVEERQKTLYPLQFNEAIIGNFYDILRWTTIRIYPISHQFCAEFRMETI